MSWPVNDMIHLSPKKRWWKSVKFLLGVITLDAGGGDLKTKGIWITIKPNQNKEIQKYKIWSADQLTMSSWPKVAFAAGTPCPLPWATPNIIFKAVCPPYISQVIVLTMEMFKAIVKTKLTSWSCLAGRLVTSEPPWCWDSLIDLALQILQTCPWHQNQSSRYVFNEWYEDLRKCRMIQILCHNHFYLCWPE